MPDTDTDTQAVPLTEAGKRLLAHMEQGGIVETPPWREAILAIEREAATLDVAQSVVPERLDRVRLSQAFLRANNFMDGHTASDAADRLADAYEALATPDTLGEGLDGLAERARQTHEQHDLGHRLGAWPNACLACAIDRDLATLSREDS